MSTFIKIEQTKIYDKNRAASATAQYSDDSLTAQDRVAPMTAKKSKVRDFLQEFLELYRDMPTLWKVKSKEYNNRCKKTDAYNVLVEKFREMEPDADRELVKRKINSIRTNYRKELKKAVTQPGYEPTLWYFDLLSFLRDQETVLANEEGEPVADVTLCSDERSGSESTPDPVPESVDQHELITRASRWRHDSSEPMRSILRPQANKNKRSNDDTPQPNKLLALACEHLRHVNDEYEILTKSWAVELKKMRADQQIFAKKAIHDVLFEGQMATLNRESVKINEGRNGHQTQTVYCYEGTM